MTTAPPPLAPSHRTTITHSVLLRRHRRGFHCALAPATVRRLLLRDSPLLTSYSSERYVVNKGKNKMQFAAYRKQSGSD
ncbi:hypothetical protein DVH24_012558 [Malus domestica]|uniref:Uncharacterized protein n=1 Tax=Malus domestica TaxID=3750 RepID=A0A498HRG0_MALDO|nr:hypothetical protein DVH24_012558 [Malus domestica]